MNLGRAMRDRGGAHTPYQIIAELAGRVNNIVRIGVIFAADYEAGKIRVRVGEKSDPNVINTDWIPWVTARACFNRTWVAPEIGEQVVLLSIDGDLRNAVALPSINYKRFPHEANHPDYEKEIYTLPDENEKVVGFLEYNRKTGIRRSWIEQRGMYRWEIGNDANIIMTRDHIQLRVLNTQLVIKENSIKLSVLGRQVELHLTPEYILAHVKDLGTFRINQSEISSIVTRAGGAGILKVLSGLVEASVGYNGVLSVRSDNIVAKLEKEQVTVGLFPTQIKAMVVSAWLRITSAIADLRVPGSALTVEQSRIVMETPAFQGVSGAASAGTPLETTPADQYFPTPMETPHVTIPPPPFSRGNAPFRPKK